MPQHKLQISFTHQDFQTLSSVTIPLQHPEIPDLVGRSYGLTISSVTAVGGGFSGATVFKAITDDGRTLAIRRTPNSVTLPAKRRIRLQSLLSRLAQLGLNQIPVPLIPGKTESGIAIPASAAFRISKAVSAKPESWVSTDDSRWQVEPWMPGTPLSGAEVTGQHLLSAFRLLNKFHRLAIDAMQATGQDEWFYVSRSESPAILRRFGIVNELQQGLLSQFEKHFCNDADLRFRQPAIQVCHALRTWLPWLQQELTAAANQTYAVQPVLRDIWRAHVLFTDQQVTGLIDLTATGTDHVTIDLSRLIRSWYGADASQLRTAFETYRTLRKLDSRELKLWQVLDASSVLLSPVTWLRRRLESKDASPSSDEVIARLTELTDIATKFRPLFS